MPIEHDTVFVHTFGVFFNSFLKHTNKQKLQVLPPTSITLVSDSHEVHVGDHIIILEEETECHAIMIDDFKYVTKELTPRQTWNFPVKSLSKKMDGNRVWKVNYAIEPIPLQDTMAIVSDCGNDSFHKNKLGGYDSNSWAIFCKTGYYVGPQRTKKFIEAIKQNNLSFTL